MKEWIKHFEWYILSKLSSNVSCNFFCYFVLIYCKGYRPAPVATKGLGHKPYGKYTVLILFIQNIWHFYIYIQKETLIFKTI